MELSPYIATLREHLTTAASAHDEETTRTAAMLSASLEPAARLAIMSALSDLAGEVTAHLEDDVVEVRLDGKDVRVVVTHTARTQEEPEPDAPPPPTGDGDISRITVRLLEELKGNAERAAADQGMSLNAFVAQAVQGAIASRTRDKGHGHQDAAWERRASARRERGRDGGGWRVQGWVRG